MLNDSFDWDKNRIIFQIMMINAMKKENKTIYGKIIVIYI